LRDHAQQVGDRSPSSELPPAAAAILMAAKNDANHYILDTQLAQ
jgi:hypothetical protein